MHHLRVTPSRRRRLAKALALGALLLAALPVLLFIGYGLWRGHDVIGAFHYAFASHPDPEIEDREIPVHVPLRVEWMGNLESLALDEASGLATSPRRDDLLWAHNDSGGAHDLFAFDLRGRDLGSVRIDDSRLGDWEDMASFELDGRSYLLVGDVGDNFHWRRVLELHVIEEPELPLQASRASPAWTIRFSYPDGARDCEALAVDVAAEQVLLLTKRGLPPELYRVPLRAGADPDQVWVAERVAVLDSLPRPSARDLLIDPDFGLYRSQPTGFDLSADLAVVVTYGDAYVYPRRANEPWERVFERLPRRVELPHEFQREAGAMTPSGDALFVTTERDERGAAALFRIELGPMELGPAPETRGSEQDSSR